MNIKTSTELAGFIMAHAMALTNSFFNGLYGSFIGGKPPPSGSPIGRFVVKLPVNAMFRRPDRDFDTCTYRDSLFRFFFCSGSVFPPDRW